jgi:hypothetical protein
MWSLIAKATGSSSSFSSTFASTAAAFNRLRESGDLAAANDLLARANAGQQFTEDIGKGVIVCSSCFCSKEKKKKGCIFL